MYSFLKDKTALYIEDEKDVLENISELLSQFFKNFYTASSAEEGYEIFKEQKIDILLVDIELPGMNGIELIKQIRKRDKKIHTVVISAYTKTDYLLESIELHLDRYIVKPLTSRKIHLLLASLHDVFNVDNLHILSENITLDKIKSRLTIDTVDISLSKKELAFLSMLAENRAVSYDELSLLWEDTIPSENAIRSFIKYLRKKLPKQFIKNNNGIGYYLSSDI